MTVDEKYFKTNTIHKSILSIEDSENSIISCGFLVKDHDSSQNDILFNYYGGLYVISGTGEYIDAVSGQAYPIYPGCVVQRMPDVLHHTVVNDDSKWLEFYFCAGANVFKMLCSLGLVTDTPVFYIGDGQDIFDRLLNYMDTVSNNHELDNTNLIFEFQKLLYYLNSYKETKSSDTTILQVCEYLKQNYKVGNSLQDIAREFNVGYEALRKQFKQKLGCSVSKYCTDLRINAGKVLLLDRHMSIKEAAIELGYCDTYAFSNQFKQHTGVSPGKFVKTWKE